MASVAFAARAPSHRPPVCVYCTVPHASPPPYRAHPPPHTHTGRGGRGCARPGLPQGSPRAAQEAQGAAHRGRGEWAGGGEGGPGRSMKLRPCLVSSAQCSLALHPQLALLPLLSASLPAAPHCAPPAPPVSPRPKTALPAASHCALPPCFLPAPPPPPPPRAQNSKTQVQTGLCRTGRMLACDWEVSRRLAVGRWGLGGPPVRVPACPPLHHHHVMKLFCRRAARLCPGPRLHPSPLPARPLAAVLANKGWRLATRPCCC